MHARLTALLEVRRAGGAIESGGEEETEIRRQLI
jgi:hypothetical protein